MSLADVPVDPDERLARMILDKRNIRLDESIKPNAFLPFKWTELSVFRHREISEEQLWALGRKVAEECQKPLYGRADILAAHALEVALEVKPSESPKNHADIVGWPAAKHEQLSQAQVLATAAGRGLRL